MKIAILGAGHGGVAAAAHMALDGHEVRLFQVPQFEESFKAIRETKQLRLSGIWRQGLAPLHVATHNPQEALSGAEVVLVIVPAFAQESMARLCGPYLEDGQYVFLLPGGFGSYLFGKVLAEMGIRKDITLGETSTLPYGARMVDQNEVAIHIRAVFNPFAAYPASRTNKACRVLARLYPEVCPANNILDVALNNTNPCIHPVPTLLSASRIEYSQGEFWLYREAMTPSVWRVMRSLDQERVEVRKAFGLGEPHCELPEEVGRVFIDQFGYEGIEAGRKMKGPKTLTDRYLTEDVPMGLVFYSSMGRIAGVPTPIIDSVIHLVSHLLGTDLWSEGRNLRTLGLEGTSVEELISRLQ
ncbi:MAG: NAD(P)-binding domain-containing protein [Firmicutes bacterium]|nr:NAD(P)-binding domain-containing protein [Bacillota bacterium]